MRTARSKRSRRVEMKWHQTECCLKTILCFRLVRTKYKLHVHIQYSSCDDDEVFMAGCVMVVKVLKGQTDRYLIK